MSSEQKPDRRHGKRLLKRAEAADFLDMSLRSFDRLRHEVFVPYVLLGRRKRYSPADLDQVILDHRVVAESDD